MGIGAIRHRSSEALPALRIQALFEPARVRHETTPPEENYRAERELIYLRLVWVDHLGLRA